MKFFDGIKRLKVYENFERLCFQLFNFFLLKLFSMRIENE